MINEKLNGKEITPFLNKLIKKSYNFTNFYQTGQGKTSDSEFIVDNSLYPLGRGLCSSQIQVMKYTATPELLKDEGYHSSVIHANNKKFLEP
ncbi:sulfatase-like hydrolase/transferase [Bacillus sp. SL00103]